MAPTAKGGTGEQFVERPFVVEVTVAEETAAIVLGTVDAILIARSHGVEVVVKVPADHSERAEIAAACEADPRIQVVSTDFEREAPQGALVISMPAGVHTGEHSLEALAGLVAEVGGPIEATVPDGFGRLEKYDWAARLPHRRTVRAGVNGAETGGRRVSGIRLGIFRRGRRRGQLPPVGGLSHERSEHLRHRARLNTNTARVARGQQRLALERIELRHEATRVALAERRLGRTGPLRWIEWRGHQVARVASIAATAAADVWNVARRRLRQVRRLVLRF
jgi:hypothetical protein